MTHVARLSIADLAGSETCRTTQTASGAIFNPSAADLHTRMVEGAAINRSLLSLRTVIDICSQKAEERTMAPPFRDSKLTSVLRNALSGNGRCSILLNLAQHSDSAHHSLSSLQFGSAASRVQTQTLVQHTKLKLSMPQLTAMAAGVDAVHAKVHDRMDFSHSQQAYDRISCTLHRSSDWPTASFLTWKRFLTSYQVCYQATHRCQYTSMPGCVGAPSRPHQNKAGHRLASPSPAYKKKVAVPVFERSSVVAFAEACRGL